MNTRLHLAGSLRYANLIALGNTILPVCMMSVRQDVEKSSPNFSLLRKISSASPAKHLGRTKSSKVLSTHFQEDKRVAPDLRPPALGCRILEQRLSHSTHLHHLKRRTAQAWRKGFNTREKVTDSLLCVTLYAPIRNTINIVLPTTGGCRKIIKDDSKILKRKWLTSNAVPPT